MSIWESLDQILRNAKVVDLSPVIEKGMPKWPTHPQIVVDPVQKMLSSDK